MEGNAMSQWPTMWRHNALTHAGIHISDHSVRALALWNRSTPTEPWTLNPIGIPSHGYNAPRALDSAYAAFPTWHAFYEAFKRAMHGTVGADLRESLALSENLGDVWKAVSSLNWPAGKTEQDYPSAVLDAIGGDFREAWSTAMGSHRATSGNTMPMVPHSSQMKNALQMPHMSSHSMTPMNSLVFRLHKGLR